MVQAEFVDGLRELADKFEGFVLDQWGVLHNGSQPYPGALELVSELRRRGKRLVLLSNSGRRAKENAAQLRDIGFNPAAFDHIVTSGEVCWQALSQNGAGLFGRLGRRCLLLARSGDRAPVAGLDLELVENPENADFIYLSWLEQNQESLLQLEFILDNGPAMGLRMLCANPDRVAPVQGGLIEAPGAIAARYQALGGEVIYVGKPYPPIYSAMLNAFEGYEKSELLCVGDSVEHDIKGANDAGLKCCLVASGIHEAQIGARHPRPDRLEALEALRAKYGGQADYVAPSFCW